jgi:hypothetical protein
MLLETILGTVTSLITRIIPDKGEQARIQLELAKMAANGELKALEAEVGIAVAQAQINANEANNASVFVSGARPFILWVCGTSFAWTFVLQPMLLFIMIASGADATMLKQVPTLDMQQLLPLMFGMLGLGSLRTYEKLKGINSK